MEGDDNSLDILLSQLTNPYSGSISDEIINNLCEIINQNHESSQIALRILAHKVQSPQEREAIQSLMVLEKMVHLCGPRFTEEIGKFRFLNEIIKVVSPKYLGHRSSSKVKQKIIELMFLWSVELKEMPKVFEAYQMLRKQGIVTEDPVHILPNYKPPTPPPPRPKDEVFDDEENAKLLRTLLQSGRPEDLQAANKLIKSMAKEVDKRVDFKARFQTEIDTIYNNSKVLSDMLMHYNPNETLPEEKDLMKELYESCERLRMRLFKLANEITGKNDPNMSRLIDANDELSKVIINYKETFGIASEQCEGDHQSIKQMSLIDILTSVEENNFDEALLDDHTASSLTESESISLSKNSTLDDLNDIFAKTKIDQSIDQSNSNESNGQMLIPEKIKSQNSDETNDREKEPNKMSALEELDAFSRSLLMKNKSQSEAVSLTVSQNSKVTLKELQKQASLKGSGDTLATVGTDIPPLLTDIFIPLDSIEASNLPPVMLYDKEDIKVILNFAKNSPRIDVHVMVITIMSANKKPVSQINFLAAVPKSMRVKLQPLSGNSLPPFSPFLPPSAITQVMLIARNVSISNEKVKLKYKFTYSLNNAVQTEVGEIDNLFNNS